VLTPIILAAGAGAKEAGDLTVDKSTFHLFNPTPSKYLRELDTDGPGTTESPYTVDAGHFQIEMALVSYTSDRDSFEGDTYRLHAWAIAPITLKVGLLNRLDAQLVLEPYNLVTERVGTDRVTRRGFGETTVRFKYNFWGNDAGPTAFAATPYVKFPTSQEHLGNHSVEGGLVLPFAAALPGDFYLGLTTKFDAMWDEQGRGYHAEFIDSIAFGHDLFGPLFGYIEFFSALSTERDAPWVATFNTGLIYELTENIQLNGGVNIGVTRSADDWTLFAGLAWRF